MCPLSALCLVARHGVSIFYLQGIEMGIVSHLVNALALGVDVGIVGHHPLIEHLVLLGGEGRGFREQTVGEHGGCELIVVIVGEGEGEVGEMEPVKLMHVTHAAYDGPVAVGDKL